ncbi:MAG: hypothetical protein WB758_05360 [Candidatus Sulfotelmatobacter sp.]
MQFRYHPRFGHPLLRGLRNRHDHRQARILVQSPVTVLQGRIEVTSHPPTFYVIKGTLGMKIAGNEYMLEVFFIRPPVENVM